jgi:polyprenyl P-hydroxybenzoate/phenylacrylic acid decarboxylase-like protein
LKDEAERCLNVINTLCVATFYLMRVLVAITGASGAVLGKRLLEELRRDKKIETHLIISEAAKLVVEDELGSVDAVEKLADRVYGERDIGAAVASGGSFGVDAMVIVPCSMKTLSAIANGYADNLITRAADVALKQERKLVLVPRETPVNLVHLRNMVKAKEAGASIVLPLVSYYNKPKTVGDMTDFVVGKILELLGTEHELYGRWGRQR